MKKISQQEAFALRDNGFKRFVCVVNRSHRSAQKNYFVVEEEEALKFIENFNSHGDKQEA